MTSPRLSQARGGFQLYALEILHDHSSSWPAGYLTWGGRRATVWCHEEGADLPSVRRPGTRAQCLVQRVAVRPARGSGPAAAGVRSVGRGAGRSAARRGGPGVAALAAAHRLAGHRVRGRGRRAERDPRLRRGRVRPEPGGRARRDAAGLRGARGRPGGRVRGPGRARPGQRLRHGPAARPGQVRPSRVPGLERGRARPGGVRRRGDGQLALADPVAGHRGRAAGRAAGVAGPPRSRPGPGPAVRRAVPAAARLGSGSVRADLHSHSTASDGTDAPAEVMRRARAAGLDAVALTDHDTVAGHAAARAALPPGLTLVPGMELSCRRDGHSVHLLGYLFDPADPELAAETARIRQSRVRRAEAMVERLAELGVPVTWERVRAIAAGGVVGR